MFSLSSKKGLNVSRPCAEGTFTLMLQMYEDDLYYLLLNMYGNIHKPLTCFAMHIINRKKNPLLTMFGKALKTGSPPKSW